MLNQNIKQLPEDEFSQQDVVAIIFIARDGILRNWAIILVTVLIGAGIGYFVDANERSPMLFEANVVFNLGNSVPSSGLGGIASVLGVEPTSDANIFTGDNFFYFVTSRPVVEKTLLEELEINGRKQILANFYIDSSGIKASEWKEEPKLQRFHFVTTDIQKMELQSRIAMNTIVKRIIKATKIDNVDRKTSFISLSVKMENQRLAAIWVTTLLKTVERMYIENQTRKTRNMLKMQQARADSLRVVLGTSEHRLARQMDLSAQVIMPEEKVVSASMAKKSAFLQQLYNEAMSNAERTRITLLREASLFIEIEGIKTPIDASYEEKKGIRFGALAGLMLAMIFTYFRTIFSFASPLHEKKG